MTHDEKNMLKYAKLEYLKFIKRVKRLELDKAKDYLQKKHAALGLCYFLKGLHENSYNLILEEMTRIRRESDFKCNKGAPHYANDKAQLIEALQYRIELINEILDEK